MSSPLVMLSPAQRRMATLVVLAVTFGMLWLAVHGVGLVNDAWAAAHADVWPTTTGTILESRGEIRRSPAQKGRPSTTSRSAHIRYSYTVAGRAYETSSVTYRAQSNVDALLQRYPVGSAVRVYYDPTQPGRAVLEPGADGAVFYVAAFLLLFPLAWLDALRRIVRSGVLRTGGSSAER